MVELGNGAFSQRTIRNSSQVNWHDCWRGCRFSQIPNSRIAADDDDDRPPRPLSRRVIIRRFEAAVTTNSAATYLAVGNGGGEGDAAAVTAQYRYMSLQRSPTIITFKVY